VNKAICVHDVMYGGQRVSEVKIKLLLKLRALTFEAKCCSWLSITFTSTEAEVW
jgi:hypothetical protein